MTPVFGILRHSMSSPIPCLHCGTPVPASRTDAFCCGGCQFVHDLLHHEGLERFYDRLLAVLRRPELRDGEWQLLECAAAWADNWTCDCFVAYAWHGAGGERLLVAVNFAPNQSQCYLRLPFADLGDENLTKIATFLEASKGQQK